MARSSSSTIRSLIPTTSNLCSRVIDSFEFLDYNKNMSTITGRYVLCTEDDVPSNVRWDVPQQHQGQIIEVAYGARLGWANEVGEGASYRRVTDRSDNTVAYSRLVDSWTLASVVPLQWAALDRTRTAVALFSGRLEAERYSLAWHHHDLVLQHEPHQGHRNSQFLDAFGTVLTYAEALSCLRDGDARIRAERARTAGK